MGDFLMRLVIRDMGVGGMRISVRFILKPNQKAHASFLELNRTGVCTFLFCTFLVNLMTSFMYLSLRLPSSDTMGLAK
jgi:hypothetical protein